MPLFFAPGYCATKFAVVGFSRSMGENTVKESVKVNCICPGPTDTELAWKARENFDEETRAQVDAQYGVLGEEVELLK